MSFLVKRHAGLPAYVPGDHEEGEGFIRLNTNESPFPPSPGVAAAVAKEINSLQFYNDPDCTQIRRALAMAYAVGEKNVTVSNGSDELLYFAFMAFADEAHPLVLPDITYSYYDLFAAALGVTIERIPLKDDFTVDYRDYYGVQKTIVLANPNAPTGYLLPLWQIGEIAKSNPQNVVIIDEAYIDFGGASALELIDQYENLLVVRTFSKSRSMAGARLGFGFGSERIIADIETIRNAANLYSVNRMTQAAGVAALAENDYYMKNCLEIMKARSFATDGLRALGFEVLESMANFVFARPTRMAGRALYEALKERKILVRRWDAPRVSEYLRITIGTMEQMQALLAAIKAIQEGA